MLHGQAAMQPQVFIANGLPRLAILDRIRRHFDCSASQGNDGDTVVSTQAKRKVLAVASGGGHWEQMMLLSPAFAGCDIVFASTSARFVDPALCPNFRVLSDTNRSSPLLALKCLAQSVRLVFTERPDVIVSTGALPGLLCIVAGTMTGARTIWIDSLANSEKPSMCGKVARHFVSRWYTQWEHIARPGTHEYEGALL